MLGADLNGIDYNSKSDFSGAFYDADTLFDPFFDTTGLVFVPEPSTMALLTFGLTILAFQPLEVPATAENAQTHATSRCIASRTLLHLFEDPISGLAIAIQKHHAHALGAPQVASIVAH